MDLFIGFVQESLSLLLCVSCQPIRRGGENLCLLSRHEMEGRPGISIVLPKAGGSARGSRRTTFGRAPRPRFEINKKSSSSSTRSSSITESCSELATAPPQRKQIRHQQREKEGRKGFSLFCLKPRCAVRFSGVLFLLPCALPTVRATLFTLTGRE